MNIDNFEFMYVHKDNLSAYELYPVPDNLDDWYKTAYNPSINYQGKTYNPSDDTWTGGFTLEEKRVSQNIKRRKQDYVSISDPLYMEWQFDQTLESEQIWRDMVLEIKSRYPLSA